MRGRRDQIRTTLILKQITGIDINVRGTGARVVVAVAQKSVQHTFSRAYDKAPEVIVTPRTDTGDVRYWVDSTANGFTIHFSEALSQEVPFSYFVVEAQE